MIPRTCLWYKTKWIPWQKCRVDAEIHQIIQIVGPYWSQSKSGKYYAWSWSKALSHAFGREEEGTVLCDNRACLTRNLCELILYFYGVICGIPENVARFLENAFHIPEECRLGLASLTDCLFTMLNSNSLLTFCSLWNFSSIFVVCSFFFKISFSKISIRNTIWLSNRLDPDQAGHLVGPDLVPNCSQKISADES